MPKDREQPVHQEMHAYRVFLPTKNGNQKTVAIGFFPDEETAKQFAAVEYLRGRVKSVVKRLQCEDTQR